MADKQVTVAVPEERVPEFYAWFAAFLAATPGEPPPAPTAGGGWESRRGGGRHGGMRHRHHDPQPWSAQDADRAAWLYHRLAPPARALFDILIDAPGQTFSGNELASRLGLEKGAHGVAGVLAWPGRYCRKLGRELPFATEGRPDGGTDYSMAPTVAELFAAARG
jgi:hypothetical protein